jgi:hypothetical protein
MRRRQGSGYPRHSAPGSDPWVCPRCGSEDVEVVSWVHANSDSVTECYGSFGELDTTWCGRCNGHTGVVLRSERKARLGPPVPL